MPRNSRRFSTRFAVVLTVLGLCAGCHHEHGIFGKHKDIKHFHSVATQIEYPNVIEPDARDVLATPPPHKIDSEIFHEFHDLTLQEAIQNALWNSQTLKDLGGTVVNNPAGARTIYEPGIRESDPRFGVEAALSAFDAQFSQTAFWTRTDRALNNVFLGDGTTLLDGDAGTFQTQFSKFAATGTQLAVRNNTTYDANNSPFNTFQSAWDTNIEAEFRHPLLQGGGIEFNRIAGPSATPGLFLSNGVLIARVNTDISLADFEAAVRNAVSEVENAYWDLYYAYRDLDAKIAARNAALEHWQSIYAKFQANTPGGEAGVEALAREQFFLLQAAVEDAQSGAPGRGSLSGSGSGGGVFRGGGGVFAAERRLRMLMGTLPQSTRLLRPIDEPPNAEVVYDWHAVLTEALATRVELRRQKWMVRRRELELTAAKNFLLPRFDAVGQYRIRGFGDEFATYGGAEPRFAGAVNNLADGDFQEWQLGVQFQAPIGFRQGHAAVRNAELTLARERAVLRDQEKQIAHDLSAAVGEVDRTFRLVKTAYNRRAAAVQQVDSAQAAFQADATAIADLSDSRRRLADADAAYYRALCDYAVALKNVHYEKGSLLSHNQVALAEGPWIDKAYSDARDRELDRRRALEMNYVFNRPTIVSQGRAPTAAGFPVQSFYGEDAVIHSETIDFAVPHSETSDLPVIEQMPTPAPTHGPAQGPVPTIPMQPSPQAPTHPEPTPTLPQLQGSALPQMPTTGLPNFDAPPITAP